MMKQILVLAALLLVGPTALAQTGNIELKTVVEKETTVTNEAGQEVTQLVPVEKVIPGDVVIYTVTYTNIADKPAEKVVITNPIRSDLRYVRDSAFAPGADVEFSVDGGEQFAALDQLTVERDGATVPASLDDLTHIRWTLRDQLDPGAQGFARFRARLN